MAWMSSTHWAGVGGEGPKRDDSIIESSCLGDTISTLEDLNGLKCRKFKRKRKRKAGKKNGEGSEMRER